MALQLDQRIDAASQNPVVRNKVMGALVKHAKFTLRTNVGTAGVTTESKALARIVLYNPSDVVFRFAAALLTEPAYDNLTDLTAITDAQVQDTVAELFPLFTTGA